MLDGHAEADTDSDGRLRSVLGDVEKEELDDDDDDRKSDRSGDAEAVTEEVEVVKNNENFGDKADAMDEDGEDDQAGPNNEADEEYIEVEKLGEAAAATTTLPADEDEKTGVVERAESED